MLATRSVLTGRCRTGIAISALVTPLATGQWPLHCHLLYHFEAGMFRTLRVLPRAV